MTERAVLHQMIGMVLKHGTEWRAAAITEINDLRSRALARNDRNTGGPRS